jgi:hypothetical protein
LLLLQENQPLQFLIKCFERLLAGTAALTLGPIDFWLLAVGCWLLAVGCWLLTFGFWLPASGQQKLVGTDIDLTTTETSDFGDLAWIGNGV